MSMLKTTMSSQVLAANEVLDVKVLAVNEVGGVSGSGDRLSDGSKCVEPKTVKLEDQKTSKSQKTAKSQKLSKLGKPKGKSRKIHQKVGIYLILTLKIASQAS